jgi:chaperone modulatory protein CbpM
MRVDIAEEALWLDEQGVVTVAQLARLSGLAEDEVRELVDLGVLEPCDPRAPSWSFTSRCVVTARTAGRLRRDLELEPHALALALSLMERIGELEARVRGLQARLARIEQE